MAINNMDLKQAIELLCAERGVTVDEIQAAIESGISKAYRKDIGDPNKAYEAEYDLNTNMYKIFEVVTVTDELDEEGNVYNPGKEISLVNARLSNPKAELGDEYKTWVDDEEKLLEFGRVASGIAKQSFEQYIRNIRHAKVLKEYKEKTGELITVEVDYFKKNGYYIKLGTTSAFLGPETLMPGDKFKPGQLIKVYVESILDDPKAGSRIILKRNTADFVTALIKQEIPEVANGQIEIVKAVREAGLRTKLLVQREDPEADIDPVGTILGRKEMRILNIMRELNVNLQERIDIIEFSENIDDMIHDALEPARLTKIEHVDGMAICYCEKQDAALAVGKRGVNVRTASQLVGIELKIQSLDQIEQAPAAESAITTDEISTPEPETSEMAGDVGETE